MINITNRFCCTLCGGFESQLYLEAADWNRVNPVNYSYFRCRGCGLVAVFPLPLEKDLAALYIKYYTHVSQNSPLPVMRNPESLREKIKAAIRERFETPVRATMPPSYRVLAALVLALAGKRIRARSRWGLIGERGVGLDIGCGDGTFIQSVGVDWLLAGSFRFLGVDPDYKAVANAAMRGLNVMNARSEALPFPDHSFDLVTMKHSLEHMNDPLAAIREAWRVLKKGGKIVVEVPNIESAGARLLGPAWSGIDAPRHLFQFSASSLRRLLEAGGFRVLDLKKMRLALCANISRNNARARRQNNSQRGRRHLAEYFLWPLILLFLKTGLTRDVILLKGEKSTA